MTADRPARGFTRAEFLARTQRAQALMADAGIDALLLTTEPEVRYFSGFLTQFWESPTRPWFLVVPGAGQPIAVIPEIGGTGMRDTWLSDVRTWSSPHPSDDGVSLVSAALLEATGYTTGARIGIPSGPETTVRMPLNDLERIRRALAPTEFVDVTDIIRALRVVKSPAEVEKIRHVCQIASQAFENLPERLSTGTTERDACRALMLGMLSLGADSTPYVLGSSGNPSYSSIIMGPTDHVLRSGDVLIIDTGARFDGYFCDFDRNFGFGSVDDRVHRAYDVVYAATEAGFEAARPGSTAGDVYAAMWTVMEKGGALGNDVGRLGHGLGMQLTEHPSNREGEPTVLEPGVVLTLEPGMEFLPSRYMVHEENIVITESGAQWLTRRAAPEMVVVD
ncbi:MAG: Xaa-Pro peptidase family protein [Pseudomonadota bacterium]